MWVSRVVFAGLDGPGRLFLEKFRITCGLQQGNAPGLVSIICLWPQTHPLSALCRPSPHQWCTASPPRNGIKAHVRSLLRSQDGA